MSRNWRCAESVSAASLPERPRVRAVREVRPVDDRGDDVVVRAGRGLDVEQVRGRGAPGERVGDGARRVHVVDAGPARLVDEPGDRQRTGRAGERVGHLDRVADAHRSAREAALQVGAQVGADDHLGGVARDQREQRVAPTRAQPRRAVTHERVVESDDRDRDRRRRRTVLELRVTALVAVTRVTPGMPHHVAHRDRPRRVRRDLERGRTAEPAARRRRRCGRRAGRS